MYRRISYNVVYHMQFLPMLAISQRIESCDELKLQRREKKETKEENKRRRRKAKKKEREKKRQQSDLCVRMCTNRSFYIV